MRKGFTDWEMTNCYSSNLTSWLYVCYKWKILHTNHKRGRPIRVQKSTVDCPRGLNSSWAFALVPQHTFTIRKHQPSRLSIITWKKIRYLDSHIFLFNDCAGESRRHQGVRSGWLISYETAMAQPFPSVHPPQVHIRFTFCAFFSTGSWAFSASGSLGLQENIHTLKKIIKVKK